MNFNERFKRNLINDNIKSHKKAELFTRKTHFDKNHTEEGKLDPPAL